MRERKKKEEAFKMSEICIESQIFFSFLKPNNFFNTSSYFSSFKISFQIFKILDDLLKKQNLENYQQRCKIQIQIYQLGLEPK